MSARLGSLAAALAVCVGLVEVSYALPPVGTVVKVRAWKEVITARITRHPAKPGLNAEADEIHSEPLH
jgi:hypothetical protein